MSARPQAPSSTSLPGSWHDEPLTVPGLLRLRARQRGDAPLLRIGGMWSSYRRTEQRAARSAAALEARGIGRGDRVVALCGNRVELIELFLGCAWLGAVVVPLNTALRGASLREPLRRARASALLVEPTLLEHVLAVAVDLGPLPLWVVGGPPAATGGPAEAAPDPAEYDPLPPVELDPGDPAAILFTSGTTGPSRGVCCPQGQFVQWGRTVGHALALGPNDVLHTSLPLFHTNALNAFLQAIVAGAAFSVGSRFSASRFFSDAADAGATVTYLLGAMVNMVLAQPASERDRAHRVTRALAPASPASLCGPFTERFGVTLLDGFGTTETNLVLGSTVGGVGGGCPVGAARPGSLGRVVDGFAARVVDPDGLDLPAGYPGELLVRTDLPHAFATGYWDDPEHTARRFRDGWFHTGDRVVRDADGWFRFVDRIKDVIRRRGENVSSYEVEQVLLAHPAVADAAVFAVPSELAEDEVMAVLVPAAGATLDLAEVRTHCSGELPYFAVPRYLETARELPLTATGKVRKEQLRATGVTGRTWDAAAR